MEFKIDTRDTYTLLTPSAPHLDANMAAALQEKLHTLADEGQTAFVIDLMNATSADGAAFEVFVSQHEEAYEANRSLVFTGVVDGLLQQMKQERVHLTLNLTPTLEEAVDIVNMEALERELLEGEQ
jgi:anti-anti-sigma regulatory factor